MDDRFWVVVGKINGFCHGELDNLIGCRIHHGFFYLRVTLTQESGYSLLQYFSAFALDLMLDDIQSSPFFYNLHMQKVATQKPAPPHQLPILLKGLVPTKV